MVPAAHTAGAHKGGKVQAAVPLRRVGASVLHLHPRLLRVSRRHGRDEERRWRRLDQADDCELETLDLGGRVRSVARIHASEDLVQDSSRHHLSRTHAPSVRGRTHAIRHDSRGEKVSKLYVVVSTRLHGAVLIRESITCPSSTSLTSSPSCPLDRAWTISLHHP